VQRTAAQKMMQEVLEKLSPAEAWSNGFWPPFFLGGVGHRQKQLSLISRNQKVKNELRLIFFWGFSEHF